jgi:hypothetical protein
MHSLRTYLLQALADPAARGSAQFGDAALDGRLSVAGPLSGTPPASPESTFCAAETAYACWSSGHSYSAIWAAGDRSHHCPKDRASVRLRASGSYFAQVTGPPGRPHPLVSILLFTILRDFCDPDPSGANARHHLTESARLEAATESG